MQSPIRTRRIAGALLTLFGLVLGPSRVLASEPVLGAPQLVTAWAAVGSANDGSPTFSPDGNTLLFARSGANWSVILESDRSAAGWSSPRIASFSGTWSDWAPEFSPDGRSLVYVSVRKGIGANLWRVARTTTGWGTPQQLPPAVNIGRSVWKPSVAADGSIYFVTIDPTGRKRLYVARSIAGGFAAAVPLPFSDGSTGDVDPEVAPDESFLVFASSGRVAGDDKDHLFIVFRRAGAWGNPQRLRYAGDDANGTSTDNEPHLGPDRRTLYFSSDRSLPVHLPRTLAQAQSDLETMREHGNGSTNAWSLSLAPLLDGRAALREAERAEVPILFAAQFP
jgi:Tol biopolymer transport system component